MIKYEESADMISIFPYLQSNTLRFAAALALVVSMGPTDAEPARPRTRPPGSFAVVIGIDRYQDPAWPPLLRATTGAKAVAAMLRQRGFKVRALYDEEATRQKILNTLEEVAQRLESSDEVLFYFSGHGYTFSLGGKDSGYIVPHDGVDRASYIPVKELQERSQELGWARHQLFLMDSCYSGFLGLTRGPASFLSRKPQTLLHLRQRISRRFITAGSKDQRVADDGDSEYSLFTGRLLAAIEDGQADSSGDDWVTFSELVAYLQEHASSPLQTPSGGQLRGDEGGSLVLSVKPNVSFPTPDPESSIVDQEAALHAPLLSSPSTEVIPRRRTLVPRRTYRIHEGTILSIDALGATTAVPFKSLDRVRFITIILDAPGLLGGQQAGLDIGTALEFFWVPVRLRGTVQLIEWELREVAFSLGEDGG